MAVGAMVTPDPAYLGRPEETTPHGLALEMQTMKTEMENLAVPLAQWQANGFDRLSMAATQCLEDFKYYEAAPIVNMLSDRRAS